MFWKFWKKKPAREEPSKIRVERLPRPKDIPELVGMYLIRELKQNADWVWKLKAVVRPRPESKDAFDFRVFDQAQVAAWKVKVKDYKSLNLYPDLILYQGWFNTESMKVQIEEKEAA